ncbi:Cysteine-rich secretory protein-related protein [Dioscorea alata]|uniref:Cysteine-rich secretory protein-related protein n=1 Tax=Dioscorea alata TaxID=55571 RepID=A0ACB7VHS8_DIOAL|nr:Cysteine-rich secretory protein-related protein [Dioscorea alata]
MQRTTPTKEPMTVSSSIQMDLMVRTLFWGSGADYNAVDAVNLWVSEGQDYDYNSNTCAQGKVCGHYTQVVWSSSTNIGCARVVCDNNGGIFITCNYNPAGNVIGERPY